MRALPTLSKRVRVRAVSDTILSSCSGTLVHAEREMTCGLLLWHALECWYQSQQASQQPALCPGVWLHISRPATISWSKQQLSMSCCSGQAAQGLVSRQSLPDRSITPHVPRNQSSSTSHRRLVTFGSKRYFHDQHCPCLKSKIRVNASNMIDLRIDLLKVLLCHAIPSS